MAATETPIQLRSKQLFFFHISLYIGAFLSHFTANIVNVALPILTQTFHQQESLVKWIAISYMLTISVTLPLMGNLADRMGHRLLHNLGYTLFTTGSFLIAISPNLILIILFRVIQALGASMFQATNMALITLHTPKEQRGRAIGLFSSAVAVGAMSGPFVGGFILQWLDWHWLFWANIPFSVVAILLSLKYVPKSLPASQKQTFDGLGIFLFATMMGAFICWLSFDRDWSWLLLITLLSVCLLFFWERRHPLPFIPYHLLQNSLISISMLVILSAFFIANAALASMPFYLNQMIHLQPSQTGYMMMIYPVSIAIAGPIAGRLSDRYGSKRFAAIGITCVLISSFMIVMLKGQLSLLQIALAFILFGTGVGLATSPTNHMIMVNIPKQYAGIISGVLALLRNLGILLGSTVSLVLITAQHSMYTNILHIFTICTVVSLICFILFGYVYWQHTKRI